MRTLPQEVELWYVLPAIRKKFAEELVHGCGLSQRKTAELLGITAAAVSQYINLKRAHKLRFDKSVTSMIKGFASELALGKIDANLAVFTVCEEIKKKGILCKVHKDKDPDVKKDCDICFSQS